MAGEVMSAREMQNALLRMAPKELIRHLPMSGDEVTEYAALKGKLVTWARGSQDHAKLANVGSGAAPMDIGAFNEKAKLKTSSIDDMMKALIQTNAMLAAFMEGGGKGGGNNQATEDQQQHGRGS